MPISNLVASVGSGRLPLQTPGRGPRLKQDALGRTATSFRRACRRGRKVIRTITAPGPGRLSTVSLFRSMLGSMMQCDGLAVPAMVFMTHGRGRCFYGTLP